MTMSGRTCYDAASGFHWPSSRHERSTLRSRSACSSRVPCSRGRSVAPAAGVSATLPSVSRASAPCSRALVVWRSMATPLTLEAGDFVCCRRRRLRRCRASSRCSWSTSIRIASPRWWVTSVTVRGTGRPDVQLGGWFAFDSPDTALLVSMLPALVHVRGVEQSLRAGAPRRRGGERTEGGRDLVLMRLVEVVLIKGPVDARRRLACGLLRGLADAQLAAAIRAMHGNVARAWTTVRLAKAAALSRSAFCERSRASWRTADGVPARPGDRGHQDLLRRQDLA